MVLTTCARDLRYIVWYSCRYRLRNRYSQVRLRSALQCWLQVRPARVLVVFCIFKPTTYDSVDSHSPRALSGAIREERVRLADTVEEAQSEAEGRAEAKAEAAASHTRVQSPPTVQLVWYARYRVPSSSTQLRNACVVGCWQSCCSHAAVGKRLAGASAACGAQKPTGTGIYMCFATPAHDF